MSAGRRSKRVAKAELFWFRSQYGESLSLACVVGFRGAGAVRYFCPLAETDMDAELCWNVARMKLAEAGMPTRPRRIHALAFRRGGEARYLQVGIRHADSGEEVLLIYRASNCPYYWVCTPSALLGGEPIAVRDARDTWAIDFTDYGLAGPPPPPRRRKKRS